jgi:hypothetical protein
VLADELCAACRTKRELLQAWASLSALLGWWYATLAALAPGMAARLAALPPVQLAPMPPLGMVQDLVAEELATALQHQGGAAIGGRWGGAWGAAPRLLGALRQELTGWDWMHPPPEWLP